MRQQCSGAASDGLLALRVADWKCTFEDLPDGSGHCLVSRCSPVASNVDVPKPASAPNQLHAAQTITNEVAINMTEKNTLTHVGVPINNDTNWTPVRNTRAMMFPWRLAR